MVGRTTASQPGSRWEEVPIAWCCPECGARKEDFEMVEI